MDNDNKALANEFLKLLLKEEINKTLKALEQKFNESETQTKARLKELEQEVSTLKKVKEVSDHDIHVLKNDKFHLRKELLKIKEELALSVNQDSLKSHTLESDKKFKELNDVVCESLIAFETCKQESAGIFFRMTENINTTDVELKDLTNRFEDHEEDYKSLLNDFKDLKDSDAQYKKEFQDHTDSIFLQMKLKFNDQETQTLLMKNIIDKSCTMLRQDSENISNESKVILQKFMEQYCNEILVNKRRIKESQDKLDALKEEVIICKKGGKVDKDIDDFMKQVGYNAKQIDKIQKLLEVR